MATRRVVDEQSGKCGPKLSVSAFTSAPWPRPNNKAGQIFTGTLQVREPRPRLAMPAHLTANLGSSALNCSCWHAEQAFDPQLRSECIKINLYSI